MTQSPDANPPAEQAPQPPPVNTMDAPQIDTAAIAAANPAPPAVELPEGIDEDTAALLLTIRQNEAAIASHIQNSNELREKNEALVADAIAKEEAHSQSLEAVRQEMTAALEAKTKEYQAEIKSLSNAARIAQNNAVAEANENIESRLEAAKAEGKEEVGKAADGRVKLANEAIEKIREDMENLKERATIRIRELTAELTAATEQATQEEANHAETQLHVLGVYQEWVPRKLWPDAIVALEKSQSGSQDGEVTIEHDEEGEPYLVLGD